MTSLRCVRGFMMPNLCFFSYFIRYILSCDCRCAPGGASEMLAQELNSLLKENISSRGPAQALFEVYHCAVLHEQYSLHPSLRFGSQCSTHFDTLLACITVIILSHSLPMPYIGLPGERPVQAAAADHGPHQRPLPRATARIHLPGNTALPVGVV